MFPSVNCFTFAQPTEDYNKLFNLAEASEEDINPDFLTQIGKFTHSLQSQPKIKAFDNKTLTGSMLLNLAIELCE